MIETEIARLELFPDVDKARHKLLMHVLSVCNFGSNQVVFKQGQKADMFYILASGKVAIQYKPYDGPEITVSHIEPGGIFGWSAAMGRNNYSSAAISVSESSAYCISHRVMSEIYHEDPETGIILLKTLAEGISKRLHTPCEQVLKVLIQGMEK